MTNEEFFKQQHDAVISFAKSLVYAVQDMSADGFSMVFSVRGVRYMVSVSPFNKMETEENDHTLEHAQLGVGA